MVHDRPHKEDNYLPSVTCKMENNNSIWVACGVSYRRGNSMWVVYDIPQKGEAVLLVSHCEWILWSESDVDERSTRCPKRESSRGARARGARAQPGCPSPAGVPSRDARSPVPTASLGLNFNLRTAYSDALWVTSAAPWGHNRGNGSPSFEYTDQ